MEYWWPLTGPELAYERRVDVRYAKCLLCGEESNHLSVVEMPLAWLRDHLLRRHALHNGVQGKDWDVLDSPDDAKIVNVVHRRTGRLLCSSHCNGKMCQLQEGHTGPHSHGTGFWKNVG